MQGQARASWSPCSEGGRGRNVMGWCCHPHCPVKMTCLGSTGRAAQTFGFSTGLSSEGSGPLDRPFACFAPKPGTDGRLPELISKHPHEASRRIGSSPPALLYCFLEELDFCMT